MHNFIDRAFNPVTGRNVVVDYPEVGVVGPRVIGDQPEVLRVAAVGLACESNAACRKSMGAQPLRYLTVQRADHGGAIGGNGCSRKGLIGTNHRIAFKGRRRATGNLRLRDFGGN